MQHSLGKSSAEMKGWTGPFNFLVKKNISGKK
jgi:hypothetical protein